ncbi:hypothetical protein QFC21_000704 [Naganishia friedmannii]|uniref:Uncharacterized protein n=1 Tax=Naganishia friedmannii TaxID=89922 RepID=A0ACC2W693_9TREE|nr:hypothetical protein QFC21_000704 [Naganishia friedmannii]
MAPNVRQIEWQPSRSAQKRDSAGSPVTPTSRPSSRHVTTASGPAMRQALFASLSGLDPGRSASTAGALGTAKLAYPSASPSVEARTLGTTRPSFSSPSLMDISRTRGLARTTAPSYADRLTELLEPWRRQGAKCYTCVALGQLRDCGRGDCPVERQIMKIEKVKHIKDVVDAHTALVRSSIRHMGYCGECFFPVPAVGQTNAFHDLGTGTDLPGRAKPCRIFASMGQKAISCGSHLWREKMLGEENAGAIDGASVADGSMVACSASPGRWSRKLRTHHPIRVRKWGEVDSSYSVSYDAGSLRRGVGGNLRRRDRQSLKK